MIIYVLCNHNLKAIYVIFYNCFHCFNDVPAKITIIHDYGEIIFQIECKIEIFEIELIFVFVAIFRAPMLHNDLKFIHSEYDSLCIFSQSYDTA